MNIKGPKGRGAYSAIIFMDGDMCVAEDNVGNVISEQAKSDYVSNVIQAAADKVGQGRIFVKKQSESYVIKSGVTLPTKTSFVSDGAKLDLTNLDSLFLTIGSEGVLEENLAHVEISGFYLLGDTTNLNTKFLKATNVPRVLSISNINHDLINNLIEVRGASYSARISNVNGSRLKGTWIKFSAFDVESTTYVPNACSISHCELSNYSNDTSASTGITILSSPTKPIDGIQISNVWIEQLQTLIYNEGFATRITNCPYLKTNTNTGFVIKNIKSGSISTSAKRLYVSGCYILPLANGTGIYTTGDLISVFGNQLATGDNAKELIKIDAEFSEGNIIGNTLKAGTNASYAALNSVNDYYAIISDNYFNCDRPCITGKIPFSLVSSNQFWGNDSYTTLKDIDGEFCSIGNNFFYNGLYWLNSPLSTYALVQNNKIKSVINVAPTIGANSTIRYNDGYLTEKKGSSSGTGAQQTIAHGLNGTPTLVMLGDIDQNAAPYQSAAADATNIYVTAGNGLDWWWKAEV